MDMDTSFRRSLNVISNHGHLVESRAVHTLEMVVCVIAASLH